MAKQFDRLTPEHQDFIAKQRVFFTASAAADGPINLAERSWRVPHSGAGSRLLSQSYRQRE